MKPIARKIPTKGALATEPDYLYRQTMLLGDLADLLDLLIQVETVKLPAYEAQNAHNKLSKIMIRVTDHRYRPPWDIPVETR